MGFFSSIKKEFKIANQSSDAMIALKERKASTQRFIERIRLKGMTKDLAITLSKSIFTEVYLTTRVGFLQQGKFEEAKEFADLLHIDHDNDLTQLKQFTADTMPDMMNHMSITELYDNVLAMYNNTVLELAFIND